MTTSWECSEAEMEGNAAFATYQGTTQSIPLEDTTFVKEFVERVASGFGLVHVKLVLKGGKVVTASSDASLQAAGIKAGSKIMVLGSKESAVKKVMESRDLPGMAGFDHELKTLAARRKRESSQTIQLPSGPYTFASYEAWNLPNLTPPPSEATKLLHKLAADPGIADVMKKNSWRVGKLSEMPPEGKEGISPVCILGVNINAGQEISLRLRTDDCKGFRRYLSIRDTLCHELAHMVYGEHDNKFKTLNSQIRNHVESQTRSVGQQMWEAAKGWDLDTPEEGQTVMSATAASSGKTLRQLASNVSVEVQALGHRDRETEIKERAAERLSGQPSPPAQQSNPGLDEPNPSQSISMAQGITEDTPMEAVPTSQETDQTQAHLEVRNHGRGDAATPFSRSQHRETEESQGLNLNRGSDHDPAEQQGTDVAAGPASFDASKAVQNHRGFLPEPGSQNTGAMEDASGSRQEDGSSSYLASATDAVNSILQSAEQQTAIMGLTTLLTILKNALEHPGDPKFRRIKVQNPVFHRRAGRLPGSLVLLKTAGFVLRGESGEQVLNLEREDPGLLWLTLSTCEQALQRISVN